MNDDNNSNNKHKEPHPIDKANILSFLTFCWQIPLLIRGYKNQLNNTLYHKPKLHSSNDLGNQIESIWNSAIKSKKKPSIWKAFFKMFGVKYCFLGSFLSIIEIGVGVFQPYAVYVFTTFIKPEKPDLKPLYIWGIIIALTLHVRAYCFQTLMFILTDVGIKMQIACSSIIYRKTLKLSQKNTESISNGKITNLLSTDVARFHGFPFYSIYLLIGPLDIFVLTGLLYYLCGLPEIIGIVFALGVILLQYLFSRKTSSFASVFAIKNDTRVRLMHEVVCNIKVIKMYNWERYFDNIIKTARNVELKYLEKLTQLFLHNFGIKTYATRVSLLLAIMGIVLTGHLLTSTRVFVAGVIFEKIRQAVIVYLPLAVSECSELNVSIKRIEDFLCSDDLHYANKFTPILQREQLIINSKDSTAIIRHILHKEPTGIFASNLTAKWNKASKYNTLQNINFTHNTGTLVAIIGKAGSGKTTLLNTFLKELSLEEGSLQVGGTVSYAAQEPWIFSTSVKQNILFGRPMDEKRYEQVIRVCSLKRDLSLFSNGDLTVVGERGVLLSGGQKARINLARAVYRQADIYLLDDPFSAVDAHVGKRIFNECINGFLAGKCTVLIIHQVHYLQNVETIYLMENGQIVDKGNYKDLQKTQAIFSELLQESDQSQEEVDKNADNYISTYSKPLSEKVTSVPYLRILKRFYQFGGKRYLKLIVMIVLVVFVQVLITLSDLFLAIWVHDAKNTDASTPQYKSFNRFFLSIYGGLVLGIILLTLIRCYLHGKLSVKATKNLYNQMFDKVLFSPIKFFHTHSIGNIMNRFSEDIGTVEYHFPAITADLYQVMMNALTITGMICYLHPWILIPVAVYICILIVIFSTTVPVSRHFNNKASSAKGPIHSYMSATLDGLSTIRICKMEEQLIKEFDDCQDDQYSMQYLVIAMQIFLNYWVDLLTSLLIILSIVGVIYLTDGILTDNSYLELTIYCLILFSPMVCFILQTWNSTQLKITNIERIINYADKPVEKFDGSTKVEYSWPSDGSLQFQNVSLKYSLQDPYVIKNVSLSINAGEKIGIVGRTGAGKSSLITIIFRLSDFEGTLLIDGVDTKTLNLNDLRSRISIIPQEPVLFSGTLRNNIDPFGEHNDEDLWSALEKTQLKNTVMRMPLGLECEVSSGGTNFSVGQKQLLCLVRAILQRNKILILDEATANIDLQTDDLIQETIKRTFKDCTVITIAHRLSTIIDSEKILVMNAGEVVEFDEPYRLLQNPVGHFALLVNGNNKNIANNLHKIAKKNYINKRK